MILDTLAEAARYTTLCSGFAPAYDFLRQPGLAELPAGRHAIDGERVYASIYRGPGRQRAGALLETHARYIDIQYVIAGVDEMGWKPRAACLQPTGPHDPVKDFSFYRDEPDVWFRVGPGSFVIFFPADAHLPQVSAGDIHKVILKIAVR